MFQQILNNIYLISPIFYKVLYMTVIGSMVGILIYIVRNIFDKKISGKWKCIIWCIVLVSLLIPMRYEIKTTHKITQTNLINKIESIKNIPKYNKVVLSDKNIYNSDQLENNLEAINQENTEQVTNNDIDNNEEIINNKNNDTSYSNDLETSNIDNIKNVIINAIIPSIWLIGTFIFVITFISGTFSIKKRVSKHLYMDERISNILGECKEFLQKL